MRWQMKSMSCSEFEAKRHLVLIGDSHLARFNVGRMAALESALDRDVIVHNHATGGANSADLIERAPVEAAIRRALFVISVGTNDLAPWKRVPLAEFGANVGGVLEVLGGRRSVVVLPPTVDEASQARSHGEQGRTNSLVAEYGRVLAKVSREAGALVVDLPTLLGDNADVHEMDGIHLNAHGYSLFMRAITAGVRSLLAD